MDLMALRRGLLMSMAQGAQFVKGSFTVPDSGASYTLNFGKTFSKYLFFIEADANAKDEIMELGTNTNKPYAFFGVYPNTEVDNEGNTYSTYMQRVNPSTNGFSNTGITSPNIGLRDSSISMWSGGLSSNAYLYNGFTYNYYIVEIK